MKSLCARTTYLAVILALAALTGPLCASELAWTPQAGWKMDSGTAGNADFDRAFSLYMNGRYAKALRAFGKLAAEAPAELAERAAMLKAECLMGLKDYSHAYTGYEEFLEKYPASKYIDRAYEGEVEIARATLGGARVKYVGLKIWSGYGLGEKVVDKITSRRPFSDYASEAQLALARSYFRRRLYIESTSAYQQYIELHAQAGEVENAMLGLGESIYLDAAGPDYDPLPYYRGKSVLDGLSQQYPGTPAARRAQEFAAQADTRLAEHYYDIGKWYLKKGKLDAARMYFRKVVKEFPANKWADMAKAYVDELAAPERGENGS